MNETLDRCEHRWNYYVAVASHAVRIRRCERCGEEQELGGEASKGLRRSA